MELKADSTALLIVDMQERFASAISEFEPIANRVKGLIEAAKQLDVSVLATEQYPQGLGSTVENIRSALPPNTPVFEKLTFSCFDCEPFRKELIKQKRDTLLIAGIEAHICILQTALDAAERGYNVYVVEDAVGSRHEKDRNSAFEFMRSGKVNVLTMEAVLFLLLKSAEHPAFTEIQKIIK